MLQNIKDKKKNEEKYLIVKLMRETDHLSLFHATTKMHDLFEICFMASFNDSFKTEGSYVSSQ